MAGRTPDKVVDAITATLDAFKADAVPIEGGPVVVEYVQSLRVMNERSQRRARDNGLSC